MTMPRAAAADVPTFVIVGCGNRGAEVYGAWLRANPNLGAIAALVDSDAKRLAWAGDFLKVPAAARFSHVDELLKQPAPIADVMVVATPDRTHADIAVAALQRGYHLLLEKPIATSLEDVERVATAAAASAREVSVAHVLRYAPVMRAVTGIIQSGVLGQLVHLLHEERIGAWHFAHSYVRGNWRREATSSPMLLAKACHDLDLLQWWAGAPALRVSSTGGLAHFRPEHAPAGAAERCLDCPVASTCPYDAQRLYLERFGNHEGWPVSVVTSDFSVEGRQRALREGPYGECVYLGKNDVPDHQSVLIEYANGLTATLEVNAFHAVSTRRLTITGSRAEVRADLRAGTVAWVDLRSDVVHEVDVDAARGDHHGGGDDGLMRDMCARVAAWKRGDASHSPTSLLESLDSHRIAFAAEVARRDKRVVVLPAAAP